MAANVALLRPDDSQQPVIVAPALSPLPRACTWTTLLDSFAPPDDSSSSSRVEARAFAEDACSLLSAGTWPPRSYSCSFCRREFRSAQALGGHMNVHRRDRARLRQSSPLATDLVSLALEPDPLHSDISQAADQPSMSFAYPAPNISKMSSSLGSSSSVWLSPAPSKPSFISSSVGAASSTSLHRVSFQDFPPYASSLPVFPSCSSRLSSQFASPSQNSLRPAFPKTGVIAFSGHGSNPGTIFDTGKHHGVSSSLLQLKSESSRIKASTPGGFHPYHTVSGKILDSVQLLRPRSVDKENDNVAPDGLDLELRLGQKS